MQLATCLENPFVGEHTQTRSGYDMLLSCVVALSSQPRRTNTSPKLRCGESINVEDPECRISSVEDVGAAQLAVAVKGKLRKCSLDDTLPS